MNLSDFSPFNWNKKPSDDHFSLAHIRREVESLVDDFSRKFSSTNIITSNFFPSADIKETGEAINISMELPGLEEGNININVNNNLLTIKGNKEVNRDDKDAEFHIVERRAGKFTRSFQLPFEIKQDPEAIFKNGILMVIIKKPAEQRSKTRQIPIKK